VPPSAPPRGQQDPWATQQAATPPPVPPQPGQWQQQQGPVDPWNPPVQQPGGSLGSTSFQELWERVKGVELLLAAGLGALALLFAVVGLARILASEQFSGGEFNGQVWQEVAIALALGAVGWAIVARPHYVRANLLTPQLNRWTLLGLAGLALVFGLVGFIVSAGYDAVEDLNDEGNFSSFDEQAWVRFSFAWALVAVAWAALTRQVEHRQARIAALAATAVAGFLCIGALFIGRAGDSDDTDFYNNPVRASAWWGLAVVLMTLAAGALLGRREE
jgi:hypothetical protein